MQAEPRESRSIGRGAILVLGEVMVDILRFIGEDDTDLGVVQRLGGTAVNFADAATSEGYRVTAVAAVRGGHPAPQDLAYRVPLAGWWLENLVAGQPRVSYFTIRGGLRIDSRTVGDKSAFTPQFLEEVANRLESLNLWDMLWISGYVVAADTSILSDILKLVEVARVRGVKVVLDAVPHNFAETIGRVDARKLLASVDCAVLDVAAVPALQSSEGLEVAGDRHSPRLASEFAEARLVEARAWLRRVVPSGVVHGGLNGMELHYWWNDSAEGEYRLNPELVPLGEPGVGDRAFLALLPFVLGTADG